MKLFSLLILNKAGGLIYHQEINAGLTKLAVNDYLVLAGTLHGVHAIATKLRPAAARDGADSSINQQILSSSRAKLPNTNLSGLQHVDTDQFSLYVFQTLTGLKFIIITSPTHKAAYNPMQLGSGIGELNRQNSAVGNVYKECYMYYCDYVMKNPFYSLDMPIKCAMFDEKIKALASLEVAA